MEKNGGGFGENTHELEKNAKMLEKINTIILLNFSRCQVKSGITPKRLTRHLEVQVKSDWQDIFRPCNSKPIVL